MSNSNGGLRDHKAAKLQHRVHYLPRDLGSPSGSNGSSIDHRRPESHNDLPIPVASKLNRQNDLPEVWILGASQVARSEQVARQTYRDDFGLCAHVSWFGKGGMGWAGVMPRFNQELSRRGPPDVLVLHCGGNDLGLVDPEELVSLMERDLMRLRNEFPKIRLVYSLLHQRQRWRYGAAPQMENTRRLVNNKLRRMLRGLQCDIVEHENIRFYQKGVFVPDGVHFTEYGNKIFLENIHKVVSVSLLHKNSASTTLQNRSARKRSEDLPGEMPVKMRPIFKGIPPKVWVIGASEVSQAHVSQAGQAAQQLYGDNFGLDARVHWFGQEGMGLAGVIPRFNDELAELEVPPDVLVLHARGNDLGLKPHRLVSQIETDIRRLRNKFPKMRIVFSLLHERQHWGHGPALKTEQISTCVNSKLTSALSCLDCEIVEHKSIDFFHQEEFVPDGVHFTSNGNKVFLDNIRQVVRRILHEQRQRQAVQQEAYNYQLGRRFTVRT